MEPPEDAPDMVPAPEETSTELQTMETDVVAEPPMLEPTSLRQSPAGSTTSTGIQSAPSPSTERPVLPTQDSSLEHSNQSQDHSVDHSVSDHSSEHSSTQLDHLGDQHHLDHLELGTQPDLERNPHPKDQGVSPRPRLSDNISSHPKTADDVIQPLLTNSEEPPLYEKPPDGGYGWVIVAASFCIQMIGIGLAMSFGVMYIELQDYYNMEAGLVAWVGAICIGLSLGAGPLSSMLAHVIGLRPSCMLGGLIATFGLFISAFAPSIYFLYVSFGVIAGIGISLSYVPAVVIVGFYFDTRRPIASGVSVAGVGFGSLIYPPLIQILIETYTWRGTMFILSAICLHTVVFASLLTPLNTHQPKAKICDLGLLKQRTFIVFSIAEVLWNIGCLVISTIAPHHSILQGVPRENAAFLLSVIGITGTLGRLIFVFIPLHWDKLTMMTVATYVSGLPMALYPLLGYYWVHVLHCVVYGFCFGVQLAVLPVVAVDLFGLERLTSAYGYLVLADGIGALFGPFLAGHLYDVTGDYTLSFLVGAILSFLSGVLMTALLVARMCTAPGLRRFSLRPRKDLPTPASEIFL